MGLSDDQKALLRLLAQREEGYEDIAALKGLSVEQVRAEVKDALAEMQAAGEVPPPLPPPPAASAEAPAEAAPAPEPETAPEPAAPPSPPPPAKSKAQADKPSNRPARPTLPAERRRLVLLTGGALGIVALILAAIAILGGGSDSGSGSTSEAASGTETAFAESPAATNEKITRAILAPVDGGSGEGLAVFGRLRKQVRLAIAAKGLEQAPSGEAYVVWLADASNRKVPVTIASVNASGEIADQYPIPAQVLLYLAEGTFDEIDISLVSTARYKAAFSKARSEKKLPAYTGSDVLRGKVVGPIVNAASKAGG